MKKATVGVGATALSLAIGELTRRLLDALNEVSATYDVAAAKAMQCGSLAKALDKCQEIIDKCVP